MENGKSLEIIYYANANLSYGGKLRMKIMQNQRRFSKSFMTVEVITVFAV